MTFDTYAKGILTVIAALLAAQAVALLRPDPATAQVAAGGGAAYSLATTANSGVGLWVVTPSGRVYFCGMGAADTDQRCLYFPYD